MSETWTVRRTLSSLPARRGRPPIILLLPWMKPFLLCNHRPNAADYSQESTPIVLPNLALANNMLGEHNGERNHNENPITENSFAGDQEVIS